MTSAIATNPDPIFRHRSLGMFAVFWRFCLPYVGLRMQPSLVCLSIATLGDCLATWYSLSILEVGNAAYARITFTLLLLSAISVLWCYHCCTTWNVFYRNEQRLVAEKEASESVLSMTCDATFWMGDDGDTLLGKSNKLEAILGSDLNGARLSDHMPPP